MMRLSFSWARSSPYRFLLPVPAFYYMLGRDVATAVIPVVFSIVAVLLQKPLLERNPKNLPLINLALLATSRPSI